MQSSATCTLSTAALALLLCVVEYFLDRFMTAASVTGGSDSQEEVCSCGGVGPCAGSAAPAEALILLSQLRTLRVLLFFFFLPSAGPNRLAALQRSGTTQRTPPLPFTPPCGRRALAAHAPPAAGFRLCAATSCACAEAGGRPQSVTRRGDASRSSPLSSSSSSSRRRRCGDVTSFGGTGGGAFAWQRLPSPRA